MQRFKGYSLASNALFINWPISWRNVDHSTWRKLVVSHPISPSISLLARGKLRCRSTSTTALSINFTALPAELIPLSISFEAHLPLAMQSGEQLFSPRSVHTVSRVHRQKRVAFASAGQLDHPRALCCISSTIATIQLLADEERLTPSLYV